MFEHMDILKCHTSFFKLIVAVVFLPVILSCDDEIEIPEGAFTEQPVEISGGWIISSAERNGVDVTDKFDFSGFNISLDMNAGAPTTFNVQNGGAPFPVLSSGSWAYDDNIYPTKMMLTSGTQTAEIEFDKAPISQNSQIEITFKLGCSDNDYKYTLIKNNE